MKSNAILILVMIAFYYPVVSQAKTPYAGIALPGVPVEITDPSTTKNKVSIKQKTKVVDKKITEAPLVTAPTTSQVARDEIPSRQIIHIIPGVNEIIPVSIGHLNRIVTPFEKPKVKTVSDVSTQVIGNTIYVASDKKRLSTMFITDSDDGSALSITLLPKEIPPRDVTLVIESKTGQVQSRYRSKKALHWEESTPYIDTIKAAFALIAKGSTPPGYTLRHPSSNDKRIQCNQPGFRQILGQVLDGGTYFVQIYKLTNTTNRTQEINETTCYIPSVIAVSSWPHTVLKPMQSTELYIAFNRESSEKEKITRPSLIGENNE